MNELKELGTRVRYTRVSCELKQNDLAAKAAVSADTVSALENGRPVTTESLQRILKALGHRNALCNVLPAPVLSPIDLQKLEGKTRKRVR